MFGEQESDFTDETFAATETQQTSVRSSGPCKPCHVLSSLQLQLRARDARRLVLLTLLKVLDVARGKGDADLVDLGSGGAGLVEVLLGSHF